MILRLPGILLLVALSACEMPASGQQTDGAGEPPSGVILQYHHVAADTPPVTSIEPAQFRKHMNYLADNGYVVWPLDRLVDAVRHRQPVPSRTVSITFDDAYVSIYTDAFPLLKERGWPFTIFVSTEFIGTNPAQYLDWDQIREMQGAGALIANHTRTHTHLLREKEGESYLDWKARVRSEIETAEDKINAQLGAVPKMLAYPYGEYNQDILLLVDELGYVGFGQQSGPIGPGSDFRVLPRFPMSGKYSKLDTVKTKLDTLPLPILMNDVDPVLSLTEVRPTLTLNFNRGDLRFDDLVCYGPGGTTALAQTGDLEFKARANSPVPVGRSRYNCTMPVAGQPGRFYWFSQLWIRKEPDGSWYPER